MSRPATQPLRLLAEAACRPGDGPPRPCAGAGQPAHAPAEGRLAQAVRGPADAQRYLTILFSDLTSSIGWSAQLDWLAYVHLLRGLRALFRATVARHGGAIARMQGDGMLATFGHDGPSASDGYRAICCALELHQAVRAIAPQAMDAPWVALHSGIYAGLTYVERGDMERGRFDLVGSAPGLAARLSGLAGRDGVLVTEQVIAPCLDDFRVADRQALRVKGWPEPLAAYPVLGLAAARPMGFGVSRAGERGARTPEGHGPHLHADALCGASAHG